jgi:hypothetical protein
MNGHSYGISKLTSEHSRELLSEGRRRQLAKTAPPRPRFALRELGRFVPAWASRILGLAASLVPSAVSPEARRPQARQLPSQPANQP